MEKKMAKDSYKKFPIGTLVKVTIPTLYTEPPKHLLGLVVPMPEEATMSPKHFLTVYLSEPVNGDCIRIVPMGNVTSVSRAYKKEKI